MPDPIGFEQHDHATCIREGLTAVDASFSLPGGGVLPGVTASFGVTSMEPGLSMAGLVNRCDEALYRAKSAGRNRVSD